MMHVAAFLWRQPATAGGGHTFEQAILREISRRNEFGECRFTILAPGPPPLAWNCERIPWIRWDPTPLDVVSGAGVFASAVVNGRSFDRAFRDARGRHIAKIASRLGVDLVWFLTPDPPAIDVPYIATVWDLQHRLQPFFPEVSTQGEWARREAHQSEVVRRAASVIVANETARQELQQFYGVAAPRIAVIGHPVDDFADLDCPLTQHASAAEGEMLFFPAQFWAHKNHACLLKALVLLRDTGERDWRVVLTGSDKGNRAHVESEAARLGLTPYVRFAGFVSRPELVDLYRSAFALVFPSFFGPENLPPLEAMQCGCPVITARVDGAAEQLGDAAIFFDPTSPTDLANAVRGLAERSQDRQELIRRGYERLKGRSAVDFLNAVLDLISAFVPYRRTWPSSMDR